MPFAKEDEILTKIVFNFKDYNAKDLVKEFFRKGWNVVLVFLQVVSKAANYWVS